MAQHIKIISRPPRALRIGQIVRARIDEFFTVESSIRAITGPVIYLDDYPAPVAAMQIVTA